MLGDAYSTVIAVMGPEEGLLFADQRDLAALLIVRKDRWSPSSLEQEI
jgi:thiamine biosynthesis lipoprotein ApbE